jgi:hypothetical protein
VSGERTASGDVWSERAQRYVESDAHRSGDDLDLLVSWAAGARTALDVATGGGHVARRLGDAAEEAEKLRDLSHVRNYTEGEWREIIAAAGVSIEEARFTQNAFDFAAWLERTGCAGEEAQRVRKLWGDRVADGKLTLDKIAIKAVKA